MTPNVPPLGDLGGWKGLQFSLMRDETGVPVMISHDIVKAYLAYVARCRARNDEELTFSDWMNER